MDRAAPTTVLPIADPPLVDGRFGKRALDVCGAVLLLVVFAPFAAMLAIAIRLDSAGPVLFLQHRHGFARQSFRIYKFRSMRASAGTAPFKQAVRDDERVTRVGRFMRRLNLDELPQLINVLRGEMSLVGPRPHALEHTAQFERVVADYARRHHVKPGLTGWAAIHGLRGATLTEADMQARTAHDLHYIDNWSLMLDLYILARTPFSRRARRNAY